MKHLRHVLRPAHWFGSSRTRKRQTQDKRRALRNETLEKRQLLAGDLLTSDIVNTRQASSEFLATQNVNPAHNEVDKYDTNGDGFKNALDVYNVIHELRLQADEARLPQGESRVIQMADVDNSGFVSPIDALLVLNDQIENGAQAVGELIEPVITILDVDGNELARDASGNVTVQPGQFFEVEIAYNDLREIDDDPSQDGEGLFGYFVNVGLDTANVLELATWEAQSIRLTDTGQLTDFDQATNRTFTFTQAGNPVPFTTREFTGRTDVLNNLDNEIVVALESFGFTEGDDFEIDRTSRNGILTNTIRYRGFDRVNTDIANITVVSNASSTLDVEVVEIDATIDTTDPVGLAGLTNAIDTRSRGFADNRSYYDIPGVGLAYDPATGFTELGGITSSPIFEAGGIPADTGETLPLPFDAFSFFASLPASTPANGLTLDITPFLETDSNVAYGINRALTTDDFLLSDRSNITIVVDSATGTAPTLNGSTLNASFLETDAIQTVDLSSIINNVDNDPLTFSVTETGDPLNAATVSGGIVTVDPSVYSDLNNGESVVINYTYDVTDPDGTLTGVTASITINGVGVADTGPVVAGPISATFNEDQLGTLPVNLLQNITDDLGTAGLSVVIGSVTQTSLSGTTDSSGITIDEPNNQLNVTPQTYDSLNAGQSVIATYTFQVTDGVNAPVSHSATVTIEGRDEAVNPIAFPTSPLVINGINEDSQVQTVNLLDGVTGGLGTLAVSGVTPVSGNTAGVSVSGNVLTITPSQYNSLPAGGLETVVFTYNVGDGTVSGTQTVSVSIDGVNDAPNVGNPLAFTFDESDAASTQSLLLGAFDPDTGTTLTVTGVTTSGNAQGITVVGNSLSINPGANAALNDNQSATFTVNFQISDGIVESPQSATVTINGESDVVIDPNSAPTVTPISQTFDADDAASTINLNNFAADADGDALTFALTNTTGSVLGTTFNATAGTISIAPSANSDLLVGQTRTVTFTYTVSDETAAPVSNTATISVNGTGVVQQNSDPVVAQPLTLTVTEDDAAQPLDLLLGATDADDDPLSVSNVTLVGNQAGVAVNGNTASINPAAYSALNTGESETVTISYLITDSNGGSVAQTATINITGITDQTTGDRTIAGSVYIDHIENFQEVITGAAPVRNGVQDADESGLAGITVTLTNAAGASTTTITNLSGAFSFTGLAAGQYTISYDVPESVIFLGATSGSFNTEDPNAAVPNLNAIGLDGGLSTLDILVSSYLASNQGLSASSDGGLQGGSVALDSTGNQELFVAGLGLTGVQFAEVALNQRQDAALLTVIDDNGTVRTARLSSDSFVVSNDGTAVQFFGGVEDFEFSETPEDLLTQEFATYRNAIDQILAQG